MERTFGSMGPRDFWSCLTPIFLFFLKRKEPSLQNDGHGIAKNKPECLKEHNGPSTANVVVPKCGSLRSAVTPPVIQQTKLGMPWVPNSEPRRMASD